MARGWIAGGLPPDQLVLRATGQDARKPRSVVARLAALLERAQGTMLHVELERISPMAVPVLIMIGRETAPAGTAEDELLFEAEALAAEAMRLTDAPPRP